MKASCNKSKLLSRLLQSELVQKLQSQSGGLRHGQGQSATKLIDGRALAAGFRQQVKSAIASRMSGSEESACDLARPCLATVQVGERPDSSLYLSMKHKACREAGILNRGEPSLNEQTRATRRASLKWLCSDKFKSSTRTPACTGCWCSCLCPSSSRTGRS